MQIFLDVFDHGVSYHNIKVQTSDFTYLLDDAHLKKRKLKSYYLSKLDKKPNDKQKYFLELPYLYFSMQ